MNFQLYQPPGGFMPTSASGMHMMGIPGSPLLGQQIMAGRGILAASPASAVRPMISQSSALAALQQPQMMGRGMGLMALPRGPMAGRAPLARQAAPSFLMAGTPPTVMSPTVDGAEQDINQIDGLMEEMSHTHAGTPAVNLPSPRPVKRRKTSPTSDVRDLMYDEGTLENLRLIHARKMELINEQIRLARKEQELVELKKTETRALFKLKKDYVRLQILNASQVKVQESDIIEEIEKIETDNTEAEKDISKVGKPSPEVESVTGKLVINETESDKSSDVK